ncbi:MAG: hypothetical protein JSR48_02520 [Verrucomicrobia bacterium]|nr:hypothetical protein [Verrucomicrobiota bacterium]
MTGDFKHVLPAFPSIRELRTWIAAAAAIGALTAAAADESPPRPPEFRRLPPLLAIREAGTKAHLPVTGLAAAVDRPDARPGDSVTVLVSLTKRDTLKQWLIRLELEQPGAGGPLRSYAAADFYTSTGHHFRFSGGTAGLRIAMIGPLEESDAGRPAATSPAVKRVRVQVGMDFLALGLDRAPAMTLRVAAERARNPQLPHGNLGIRGQPFPPDVVARDGPVAAAAGVTEADERSIIGSVMALQEFFQLASRTPGLDDVLRSVLDLPWWSIIRNGGKIDLNIESLPFQRELVAADWGLPAAEKAYAAPFLLRINGRPALVFQLALAAPKPPLTVSAGIVGLAACAPDGDGPVLTFQVVSSEAGK